MIVLVACNSNKKMYEWNHEYNGKIGLMWSPQSGYNLKIKTYAIDNGCFHQFNYKSFKKLVERAKERMTKPPLFIVCPDVYQCHERTMVLWNHYSPILKEFGFQVAFVAQNGCTPETVPNDANWIFIGGGDPWKMENIHKFTNNGKPVHVGRVNSIGRLNHCELNGVTSVDGSGWFRGKNKRLQPLKTFIDGDNQCSLF